MLGMTISMQQLVLGIAHRVGIRVARRCKLRGGMVIGQQRVCKLIMVEFMCEPLRVESIRAKTHHNKREENEQRNGFSMWATHYRYFVISLKSSSVTDPWQGGYPGYAG